MRHRQCRRVGLSTFHGFALWASPAVTHGVSPLGTVGEHVEAFRLPPPLHIAYSLVDALIHYFACLCSCISCIVCRPSHLLSSSAASTQRYSRLWRRRTASVEGETQMDRGGCCATPPVSEGGSVYLSRVRPLGVTRGYAWCVPSGDSG